MPAAKPSAAKSSGIFRGSELATRLVVALLGAVLATLAGIAGLSRIGDPLVNLGYDLPFIVHRAGSADQIRIVYLSELDKNALDRTQQARLLDRLGELGARMVVYDLIFDLPSEDPRVDEEFAAAMRRFRGVDDPDGPQRHVFLACGRRTFQMTGASGEQLIPPNDTLLDAADNFGLVAMDDQSFMIRKLAAGSPDEPALVWHAAIAAGADLDEARRMDTRWMNYAGPPADPKSPMAAHAFPWCPPASVLDERMSPAFFHDKIVLIGGEPGIVGEALGKDLFETPFHRFQVRGKIPFMSGVEVQANALANLLHGNWLVRSSTRSDLWLVSMAGILIGIGLSLLRPAGGVLAAFTVVAGFATAGVVSVHYGQVWFPWTLPAFLQTPVALLWGVAANLYVERHFRIKLNEEQKAIREAFSKYLSPQMLDRLTRDGFTTDLGGEKIEAAMMFTDLENFTNMCERISDPHRIVETMNHYFERTTTSIFKHDGVVIKFIGDAIFAAWGAPFQDPDSATKAALAAWDLFENDKLVVEGTVLRTRIGLHFGEVLAGNIGSSRRVDYTLIGDAVNLAARLEGVNKMLGTHILMSGSVAGRLDDSLRLRRVGNFRVKGRREPVMIHELLGPAVEASEPEWLTVYHEALERLEANDTAAAAAGFTRAMALREGGHDGPAVYLLDQIRNGSVSAGGLVTLTEK